jgi:hypothetical protein
METVLAAGTQCRHAPIAALLYTEFLESGVQPPEATAPDRSAEQ